jgi:hypothetical protein
MNATSKRITLIILTALLAFGFLVGGARFTAFAREAESFSYDSSADTSQQPGEVEVYGTVEAVGLTSITIDGREYQLMAGTEFKDQVQVGDFVKLHVFPTANGLAVREIELSQGDGDSANDNGDDSSNDNGDDNSNDNGDDSSNDKGDDNSNDNGDDNSNDNGDDDSNDNGDDDSNDNSNDNDDDENGNDNGDDD